MVYCHLKESNDVRRWIRLYAAFLPALGQAKKALELFPDAQFNWFNNCGHFPQWDQPQQTVDLILRVTGKYAFKEPSTQDRLH